MPPLLLRASLRHIGRRPFQAFLSVLGIALGVGVVLSLDLAIESARQGLRASVAIVGGQATHRVEAGVGGVPSGLVVRLRAVPGVEAAAPVVEGFVTSPRLPGRPLRLLGIDPLSEAGVRPSLAGAGGGLPLLRALSEEGGVLVEAGIADEAGLTAERPLPVVVDGREGEVRLSGVLEPRDRLSRAGFRDVLVADIATAQELFRRFDGVDRIDLVLAEEGREEILRDLGRVLPPGVRVHGADAREREMEGMIRAFDLNLSALGLLALLLGAFLIYNTMTFAVVQRRRMFGTLRALGATRAEVVRGVLVEALLLGTLGSALGLVLGIFLGRGLTRLVTRTINDLYFVLSVEGMALGPFSLGKGVLLGLGATALAALPATWEAVSAAPRSALARSFLEERARAGSTRLVGAGALLILAGVGSLLLPTRDVGPAFFGLFLLVLGMASLIPAVVSRSVGAWAPLAGRLFGLLAAMAARGVAASLSRTGPAMSALVVAVSVTLGLGLMISSFRGSVDRWLDVTLASDVYVSVPSPVSSRSDGTLPPEVVEALLAAPGIDGWSLTRSSSVPGPGGEVRLLAVESPPGARARFELVSGSTEAAFGALERGEGVVISEPLAFRRDLSLGQELLLLTPDGERAFPVLGVFRDYGSDQGIAILSRDTYLRHWEDPGITSMGLDLDPGLGVAEGLALLRGSLPEGASVNLRSNRELREATLQVFDRTFRITSVLQALVFVVAFIGVMSALMALQLERERELGVLRATGLVPGEVWRVVLGQTGLMGIVAGLLALPVGLIVAFVMTHVVNRRSFGWTVDLAVSPGLVGQALLLAVVGALLAGLYPSWKMSRTSPSMVLREE